MTLKLSNFAVCPATKELRQIPFDIGNVAPDKKYNANNGQYKTYLSEPIHSVKQRSADNFSICLV